MPEQQNQKPEIQAPGQPQALNLEEAAQALAGAAETLPAARAVGACVLCGLNLEWHEDGACRQCRERARLARWFRYEHFRVPARYALAVLDGRQVSPATPVPVVDIDIFASYLFVGDTGRGKTDRAYALLHTLAQDPRLTIAAYSWTELLAALREGYNAPRGETSAGARISAALKVADVAFLDNLGAEKAANLEWLREELFGIVDMRWAWKRQSIFTTDLVRADTEEEWKYLDNYLGDRILSRIRGMCQVLPFRGDDKRQ